MLDDGFNARGPAVPVWGSRSEGRLRDDTEKVWQCASDSDTIYTAGIGLSLTEGGELSVDQATVENWAKAVCYDTEAELLAVLNEHYSSVIHDHDALYYTKAELDNGQLDSRYYSEAEIDTRFGNYYDKTELDSGQLDTRYYTESEIDSTFSAYYSKAQLDNGQLDSRYYMEAEVDTKLGGYYTKSQLDAGQLDSRYYSEGEADNRFLNVTGGDTMSSALTIGNFNGNHLSLLSGNSSYGWKMETYDYGSANVPFIFSRKRAGTWSEVLRILNENGRVGIGTSTPQKALDVLGEVQISGYVYEKQATALSGALTPRCACDSGTWSNECGASYVSLSDPTPCYDQYLSGWSSASYKYERTTSTGAMSTFGVNANVAGQLSVNGNTSITGMASVSGNMGIGTTSPQAKLHVNGEAFTSGPLRIGGNTYIQFDFSDSQIARIANPDFGSNNRQFRMYWGSDYARNHILNSRFSETGPWWNFESSIGATSSSSTEAKFRWLFTNSTTNASTEIASLTASGELRANSFNCNSSIDLKTDISELSLEDSALIFETLKNLPIYRYRYKTEPADRRPHLGLITENAPEEVLSEDGKAVSQYEFTSYLAAGFKALAEENEELVRKVAFLEETNKTAARDTAVQNAELARLSSEIESLRRDMNVLCQAHGTGVVFSGLGSGAFPVALGLVAVGLLALRGRRRD
jgi:hypothetical protein